jgi:hypothetical protein
MSETPVNGTGLWTRLDVLPDKEIATLGAAAVAVLSESADPAEDVSVLDMPDGPLAGALHSAIAAHGIAAVGAVGRIIGDGALARPVAVEILKQIAAFPTLAHEIELTYESRKRMLVADGGVICGAALLLLVLKLKKIRVGKPGMEIEFTKASEGILNAVLKFVGL